MKTLALIMLFALWSTGCHGQKEKENKMQQDQPQVSWKVNKEVDKNGNVIRYDSTYVWSWSNNGATGQVKVDSVINEFRKSFDTRFHNIFNRSFGKPVWSDSLFYRNFLKPDYFMQKWKDKGFDIRSLMERMDSSRNAFLQERYPGLETKVL